MFKRLKIVFIGVTLVAGSLATPARANNIYEGFATELTQILNNIELGLQTAEAYKQTAEQIMQTYYAAKNIENLGGFEWSDIQGLLGQLAQVVEKGQALAYTAADIAGNYDQTFHGYDSYKAEDATKYQTPEFFIEKYQDWQKRNRDTIQSSLEQAGLQFAHFEDEATTINTLSSMSESADGRMKAIQVGNQIAVQEIQQLRELRQLVMAQIQLEAQKQAKASDEKDFQQAATEKMREVEPGNELILDDGKSY